MTTRQIRMLRAAVFATLCVALAATAHVSMSAAVLPGSVLVGAFAATAGGTWLLAGQRRGLAMVSGWMVAVQAVLHTLFEATASVGTGPVQAVRVAPDWVNLLLCTPGGVNTSGLSPDGLARMAGLDPDALSATGSGAVVPMNGMAGMSGMSGMPGAGAGHGMAGMAGLSAGMVAAHLLAALACALLLWRGEAAIIGLFEVLHALAGAFLPVLALLALTPRGNEPAAQARPRPCHIRLPRLAVLSHALVRRGPPHAALAL
ncbi:hypothetical protein [Kitasatospora kifunensis]|uniref:PE-PGRS family protein n=1 Tax=Kitasatospora kifunensis TaxID=58351 RepID=A0A7W7R9B7_KITKI|nr:hypothetical protein [Kitasatospora kifunensis]MBB4927605.1 hypothetical protein [Kitasatospora kifunensis]